MPGMAFFIEFTPKDILLRESNERGGMAQCFDVNC